MRRGVPKFCRKTDRDEGRIAEKHRIKQHEDGFQTANERQDRGDTNSDPERSESRGRYSQFGPMGEFSRKTHRRDRCLRKSFRVGEELLAQLSDFRRELGEIGDDVSGLGIPLDTLE